MSDVSTQQAARIDALMGEMTLEEKIAQLTGVKLGVLVEEDGTLSDAKLVEHLSSGIGQITLSGGATTLPPEEKRALLDDLVQAAMADGHLHPSEEQYIRRMAMAMRIAGEVDAYLRRHQ